MDKNLEFKIISTLDESFIDIYNEVFMWDKENMFFQGNNMIEDFSLYDRLKKIIVCYLDKELVGYGEISYFLAIYVSYIINPKFRRYGYGKKLVEYLVSICNHHKFIDVISAEILKENSQSIEFIKKCGFSYDYSNGGKVIYSKKLQL